MGARCSRCDTELKGSDRSVDTVDRGVMCADCVDETGAEPLPDVTEPGSWEVNDHLGEPPSKRGPLGAIRRMPTTGWAVFGAGLLMTVPVTVWFAWRAHDGLQAMWMESGGELVGGLAVGAVLWLALCVVMFFD